MMESKPIPWGTVVGVLAGVLSVLALIAGLLIGAKPSKTAVARPTRAELQAADQARLASYGWVEKPAPGKPGVVHIPVDRAAELWLKERAP
jgi:hypothetical protein